MSCDNGPFIYFVHYNPPSVIHRFLILIKISVRHEDSTQSNTGTRDGLLIKDWCETRFVSSRQLDSSVSRIKSRRLRRSYTHHPETLVHRHISPSDSPGTLPKVFRHRLSTRHVHISFCQFRTFCRWRSHNFRFLSVISNSSQLLFRSDPHKFKTGTV